MGRVEDCLNEIRKIDIGFVSPKEYWHVNLMSDIAISLATIADALEEQNEISKDGIRDTKETWKRMFSDNDKYYEWMKSFAKGENDE